MRDAAVSHKVVAHLHREHGVTGLDRLDLNAKQFGKRNIIKRHER
jgi:hypothetical protein